VVLYFYPKDQTPGCTTEACDFRDRHARIAETGAALYGVSKDSIASHERFIAKHHLPFPLLFDADSKVAKAYGAYGNKVLYGKTVEGTIRSTFVIDERGRIAAVWSPVKVAGHADQVLAFLTGATPAAPPGPARKKK
jgi:peroxiredoxin Q/BCP